ncbi:MAG: hypothetical protein ACM3ZV_07425 [Bacillota bacterium]
MDLVEQIARLLCSSRGADPDQPVMYGYPLNDAGQPVDSDGNVLFRLDETGNPVQRRDEATGDPVFETVPDPENPDATIEQPVYLTAPPAQLFDVGWQAYAATAAQIAALLTAPAA